MTDFTNTSKGLLELNKKLLDYSMRFNQVLASGVAPTIRDYAETAAQAVESAAGHAAKLAECKSPKEAIEGQAAFTKEMGERFQHSAQQLLAQQQETGEQLKSLIEEGLEEFVPDAGKTGQRSKSK